MESIAALIIATAVLVLIPGPNVALIVARSLQFGLGAGVATVVGTTIGVGLQLILVIGGIAVLIELAGSAFSILRWLGVAYLLWFAYQLWQAPQVEKAQPQREDRSKIAGQGILIAVLNPKTLVFNAAFLPQFVDVDGSRQSLFLIAAIYLLVLFCGDMLWAVFANTTRTFLRKYRNVCCRMSAAFIALAGLGLALARRTL